MTRCRGTSFVDSRPCCARRISRPRLKSETQLLLSHPTMPRIDRLEVAWFRGISKPVALIFGGKSVLLFGENGTCKSSFVDALEKILTNRISTLDGRAAGISSEKHGPHIRKIEPIQLRLVFDDKRRSIVDVGSDIATLPPELRAYLTEASHNLYILRRRQLLQFVESQPRDRYELIRPFLSLERVNALETVFKDAKEQAEREAYAAREDFEHRLGQLTDLLGRAPASDRLEQDLLNLINAQLSDVAVAPIESIVEISIAIESISTALSSFGDLSRESSLLTSSQALTDASASLHALHVVPIATLIDDLRAAESRESSVLFEAVLDQGAQWIKDAGATHCPLCEQSITAARVLQRIDERLVGAREVLEKRRAVRNAVDTVRRQAAVAEESLKRAQRRFEAALIPASRFQGLMSAAAEAVEDLAD